MPSLAQIHLSYFIPGMALCDIGIINTTFSILAQSHIPFNPINQLKSNHESRFAYCAKVDQLLKYYIQLYIVYVLILKHFPCSSEIDLNVKDWNFVIDKHHNIYLLDGLSVNLSAAIIYTVKEKLDQHRGLDIISDTTNTKFAKTLRATRKKHLLYCSRQDSQLGHRWIDELASVGSSLKVMSRIFLEYKKSVFKFSPLACHQKQIRQAQCLNDMYGPCCFWYPDMVVRAGHELFCKSKYHKGIDIVSQGCNLFPPGSLAYKHCSELKSNFDQHVLCKNCKTI
jgi:hypothetical protein